MRPFLASLQSISVSSISVTLRHFIQYGMFFKHIKQCLILGSVPEGYLHIMALSDYYKSFSLSKVPRENLRNEELANLYVKPKKEKKYERPKIIVWKANAVHQADLCEMPKDPLGFSYFLIVIDVATRKLDAEPLKTKTAQEVLDGFITIYARQYLQPPTVRLEVNAGNEFKSVVHNYFTNVLHVFIKTGQPGHHKQQAYAEKGIQTLQKPLIQRMTAQEMLTGQTSTE